MRFLFSILSLIIFLTLPTFAQSARPALAKPYLVAPVVLDNQVIAQAWVFPRDDKRNFAVEAKPLLEGLQSQLKESLWLNLKNRVRPEGVVTLLDLEGVGLSIFFDEARLELKIDLPLKHRRGNDLDLNYAELSGRPYKRPDAHSGYLNLRMLQSFQYGAGTTEEKLPLSSQVDLVESIKGFVFESSGEFLEGDNHPWKRQDTRIRRDDEDKMIRYTLGDLTLGSRGFQIAPNLAGLSVVREFSIQPYKTLRPLSNTEIVIKRPSLVEVYVNGFLYSQLRLAPGVFNIRDFPLAIGQNNVKVKIRDDFGQEEVYDFSVLFENTLLGKGVQEFSYAVGLPWTVSGADRAYDNTGAAATFFHRVGVTDELTLGLNFQNYLSQSLSGIEISGISRWGYLSFDGGYSSVAENKTGFAEKLRYRTLDRMLGRDVPVVLTLEAENRDPDFIPVSVFDIGLVSYVRRYDSQLNFRFLQNWFFGVGAGVMEVPLAEDERQYRSNLVVPVNNQTRVELSYSKIVGVTEEDRGLISLFWNEPQGKYSASAYYDSLQKTANLTVNRNNMHKYDDVRASASVQGSDGSESANLMAEYLAQPLSLRLEHFTTRQNSVDTNTTSLGLNTGIAWVGSHAAFTQPIFDSFVLVHSDLLPKDQELMINPNGEKGDAQLGPQHTTVLRDQSAYYKYTVNVDSTSLPVGYLLEKEYFNVQPTYRSGVLIDLNLKKKIMVRGRVVDQKGQPVAYVAGDILNAQDQLVDNTFFTNKNGGFLIEGLEPGKYKIVTDRPYLGPLIFEVTESPNNSLDLGSIVLKKEDSE
ncbi:carboxypeptidase regulatory-like domain-containing protein [Bdellovibrio bacteriovorus]|uniref:carboxypeptidase regulatory-like domain-containing protein n=1 Tax=Bdellovibrio bacteriovorus TaxID=959 RepID=UPI0035A71994